MLTKRSGTVHRIYLHLCVWYSVTWMGERFVKSRFTLCSLYLDHWENYHNNKPHTDDCRYVWLLTKSLSRHMYPSTQSWYTIKINCTHIFQVRRKIRQTIGASWSYFRIFNQHPVTCMIAWYVGEHCECMCTTLIPLLCDISSRQGTALWLLYIIWTLGT